MTIRRGEDWGEHGPLAASAPVCHDDASAAAAGGFCFYLYAHFKVTALRPPTRGPQSR